MRRESPATRQMNWEKDRRRTEEDQQEELERKFELRRDKNIPDAPEIYSDQTGEDLI